MASFPVPAGQFRISTGGGSYAQWSPDGRDLYYVSLDNKLVAATFERQQRQHQGRFTPRAVPR
jgi:hypothetical protein